MPTNQLRRFSNVDVFGKLCESDLRALLSRYGSYFEKRQITLQGPLDLERLAAVFLAPDEGLPESLVNALSLIEEMSSPSESEDLVEAVRSDPALTAAIDLTGQLTALDLAIKVHLAAPELLEREHAERFVEIRKAFEYYSAERPVAAPVDIGRPIAELESDLGEWFASKLKGEHVRVLAYQRSADVYFVVRHGETLCRERALRDGKDMIVFYRPERSDVLVCRNATGELRVNAVTKGERELYRRRFGLRLFGSEEHFRRAPPKYTLKPLLGANSPALVCSDVDGIESADVVDVTCLRPADDPANERLCEVRIAVDGSQPLKSLIPEGAEIVSARFRVKFARCLRPRHVTVRLPNIAMFARDDDDELVNEWLAKRGFVVGA